MGPCQTPPAMLVRLLLAVAAVAAAAPAWVPVGVMREADGSKVVVFQRVDMSLRTMDPTRFPMFADLLKLASGDRKSVTAHELAAHLDSTSSDAGPGLFASAGAEVGSYARPDPAGFVFHEARVGSTLAANSACPPLLCRVGGCVGALCPPVR